MQGVKLRIDTRPPYRIALGRTGAEKKPSYYYTAKIPTNPSLKICTEWNFLRLWVQILGGWVFVVDVTRGA